MSQPSKRIPVQDQHHHNRASRTEDETKERQAKERAALLRTIRKKREELQFHSNPLEKLKDEVLALIRKRDPEHENIAKSILEHYHFHRLIRMHPQWKKETLLEELKEKFPEHHQILQINEGTDIVHFNLPPVPEFGLCECKEIVNIRSLHEVSIPGMIVRFPKSSRCSILNMVDRIMKSIIEARHLDVIAQAGLLVNPEKDEINYLPAGVVVKVVPKTVDEIIHDHLFTSVWRHDATLLADFYILIPEGKVKCKPVYWKTPFMVEAERKYTEECLKEFGKSKNTALRLLSNELSSVLISYLH